MCGIFGIYDDSGRKINITKIPSFNYIKYRGPDDTKLISPSHNIVLGFHRLAIIDPSTLGNQPLENDGNYIICNGEIYNYKELRDQYNLPCKSDSDSEVILCMFNKFGIRRTLKELDGVFSFIIWNNNHFIVARDPIGIRPLFYGVTKSENNKDRIYYFASEAKSIVPLCESVNIFKPGHFWSSYNKIFYPYYHYIYNILKYDHLYESIYTKLCDAVAKRMGSDRPIGVLLSGGLDSSIIASLVKKMHRGPLHSFSIGLRGSPDLKYAKKVANHIGTIHHQVEFTVDEGINVLDKVIYHLESYDTTTIRASVPHYLLAKYISTKTDIKVLFSGEGADEIFGGYLYFRNAPNSLKFGEETQKLIKQLHQFDVLRTDRCTAAWGLEVRVPFLDISFLNMIMSVDPKLKICNKNNEKYILRKSFESLKYIPDSILWREKDAFSDGCGYSWIPRLQEFIKKEISDEDYNQNHNKYIHNMPLTKEEYYYRKTFDKLFPNCSHLITSYWRPNWVKEKDPSAKLLYFNK